MAALISSRSLWPLVGLLLALQPARADQDVWPGLLRSLFTARASSYSQELSLLDTLFLDVIPPMIGQPACNAQGTANEYKNEALYGDYSSQMSSFTTMQDMITAAGFEYDNFNVVSPDGYRTQLIRLINPLADWRKLKLPPVMFLHGGIIDPTCWLWASTKKHHPEKYPREPQDGPIRSYNRSLAFTLANDGHDVWLVGTRGSNKQNEGRRFDVLLKTILSDKINLTMTEALDMAQYLDYYSYSMNEIIDFEIDAQIDKVLEVTAAKKVNLITYSLSTMTTMPYLTHRSVGKESKVHNYVQLAPIINQKGTNKILEKLWNFARALDDNIGTIIFSELITSSFVRTVIVGLFQNTQVRYLIHKFLLTVFAGSSPKYRTCLDLNVVGHIFQETSFREVKHYCQQILAGQMQKYDYGPITNQILYGQLSPPVYDLSNLKVSNWMVVSAANDALSPPDSVFQVINSVKNIKPRHIHLENYNHLDLTAAFDCDNDVNLPIMEFLNEKN